MSSWIPASWIKCWPTWRSMRATPSPIPVKSSSKSPILRSLRRTAGIVPILATVVPVTRGAKEDVPGRLELIRDYNDWVREFASSEGIAVLDLERAVRVSHEDRSLPASKSTDGMHLIPRTYSKDFDPIVYPTLVKAFEKPRCPAP